MRARLAFFLITASASATLFTIAACSSDPAEPATLPLVEGGGTRRDTGTNPGLDDADVADTFIPPGSPSRIYAHTKDTLYLYEPVTNDLETIGRFACLGDATADAVVDLAVDRTNTVYATTFFHFLKVDPLTGSCTIVHELETYDDSYPNALSFVPAGTVDPTREALVGYAPFGGDEYSTTYVRIDTTTGIMSKIGDLNPPAAMQRYVSSGDLVSLIRANNTTYLTVRALSDAGVSVGTDLLAEVDPATGTLKRIIGDTKQTNIFGLGYWGGFAYGFSDQGVIAEIDPQNGSSQVVKILTGGDGGAAPWYGAGVTTEAPISR